MKNKIMKYLKKININIYFILFFVFIFSSSIFVDFQIHSDDIFFHLNRIQGLKDAFLDGQFLPKIYPYTNNGYGYANSLFYCDIFFYPAAILYMLGFSLVISYKIMLFTYIIIGTILVNYLANKLFKNNFKLIFIIMSIYCLNPYRYIVCFYRSAFSEFLAITFLPIVIYSFIEIFYNHKNRPVMTAMALSLILLSHNISFIFISIIYVILYLVYFITSKSNRKDITILTLKVMILGFLITMFYTLPMLEQLFHQEFKVQYFSEYFDLSTTTTKFKDLINPLMPINTLDYVLETITNYSTGIVAIFIPLLNINKIKNKWILTLTIIHYVIIAIIIGIIPIHLIDILNTVQFVFRFNFIIIFTSITLVSYALYNSHRYYRYFAIGILLVNIIISNYNIINICPYRYNQDISYDNLYNFDTTNMQYNNYQLGGGEYLPYLIYSDDYYIDSKKIKTLIDTNKIDLDINYNRKYTKFEFNYQSDNSTYLMLPLTYYYGYRVYAINDKEKIKLDVYNDNIYKKVSFNTLVGDNKYYIYYHGTNIQLFSLIISLITLLSLMFNKVKTLT